jgi:hypothetical protein
MNFMKHPAACHWGYILSAFDHEFQGFIRHLQVSGLGKTCYGSGVELLIMHSALKTQLTKVKEG